MPGNAPATSTERDALLTYLVQQRDGLKYAAYGLTEEQLRARPTVSALTLGGLIKHAALTERGWLAIVAGEPTVGDEAEYGDSFALAEDESAASLLALVDAVAAETDRIVRSVDLDAHVQLPPAPWFPDDPQGFQVRWVLLHVIEELARHAGHADILREHLDGATMYELMAAAEGWPETDWLKPWRPAPSG